MRMEYALIFMLVQTLAIGALCLLYPRISRRGLLFGVYVGEEAHEGDAGREITRSWRRGMILILVLAMGAGIILMSALGEPWGGLVSIAIVSLGSVVLYFRAYGQARALGRGAVPQSAAPLTGDGAGDRAIQLLAMALGLAGGLFAIGYAWGRYGELPARIPTHFGPSGAADVWRAKSFTTVMLLPLGTLIMGVGLSTVAFFTARAKRAVRLADGGVSFEAQIRFRRMMSLFLSGTALVVTAMMALLSVGAIRVAAGEAARLPAAMMILTGILLAYALVGSLVIAIRYGQGGSRLERTGTGSPLTDGLAENRFWRLGIFYVNRDDPSLFVEKRFGLGYTINFGNPRAVVFLAAFTVLILGIALAAILSS